MPILTLIAVVVFAGYALYMRVYAPPSNQGQVSGETDTNLEVSSQATPVGTPSSTPVISPQKTSPSPTVKSGSSKIDISVDARLGNSIPASEKIVYPGAVQTGGNSYETETDGNAVYDWYKSELGKRTYQIRNNVKTSANEKFKAILQAVSGNSSIKVTLDQENTASKTHIVLE